MGLNTSIKRVEPFITPKRLKDEYLFGIFPIVDDNGNEMPDSTLQRFIDQAASMLEHELDTMIVPTTIEENRDYHANDYMEWGYFQLDNLPVRSVTSCQVVYLQDADNQPEVALEIPSNWFRLRGHDGILRLVPNNRFPAQLQVDGGGSFFPELFRRNSNVPDLWRITYEAGFEDGKVPVAINTAIGLMASLMVLSPAGNLVLGAGIASESLSLDGLSESVNTTQSAENSAYSATRKEYLEMLRGRNKEESGLIKVLRDYYRGAEMTVL